ncbi:protein NODULATION SIGNALING PATHWAY 2-like [Rutidosis leptorrhynchoides]|uniref:protein NODULATION SIGNALING PATHWAY 2-like n=1 Tax=Rutidosis leptorrhynchoides TaxID=125765 RepID=UPI003A99AA56
MMQQELFESLVEQEVSQYGLNMGFYACDGITTPEGSTVISSDSYFHSNLPSDFSPLSNYDAVMMSENVGDIAGLSATSIEDVLSWWAEIEEKYNISSDYSIENEGVYDTSFLNATKASIVMSPEDMEVEGETSLFHMLKAYGEAMEMGQRELVNVIVEYIKEKASPIGSTIERISFNLFHSGNQVEYIKQESMKNFNVAFKAFYEIFPYGRFAHLAANSAIIEEIIRDSRKVHIIDFDMGEGIQWSAMLGEFGKFRKELKLTSVRTNMQICNFEVTKSHLLDYANGSGLKLEVNEIMIGDLVREIEGSEEREFLAFNCMVGLPHMRRTSDRNQVMEFLMIAKRLLYSKKGIITFGDGEDLEKMDRCNGYGSFFDECLMHYHALYESMERNFPDRLTEARIAMEFLFVSPYVSSLYWCQKWQNVKDEAGFNENLGLTECRLSDESVMEAKELVDERQSLYKIRVEGQQGNEMVLEWRGTPLVRVSAWK